MDHPTSASSDPSMYTYVHCKHNEDKILNEILSYIQKTYSPDYHYVGDNNIEAVDVWESMGSLDTTARDTAIKYLLRLGKKEGFQKKDCFKAVHYILLMIDDLEKKGKFANDD